MSKLKSPLFSLDGRGSVGEVISYAKRRGVNLAESKPIPKDQRTLLQMYHRWLYEDYAYLWKQQTLAIQAQYRSLGAKCHLTGYQYWMSYQLTNLPDIVGMWHLDERGGDIAHDFSRNHNDGTIRGAVPVKGAIDYALYGDGVNGTVALGNTLDLCGFTTLTMEYFVYPEAQVIAQPIPFYRQSTFYLGFKSGTLQPIYRYWPEVGGVSKVFLCTTALVQDQLSHLGITFDGTWVQFYINGIPKDKIITNRAALMVTIARPFYLISFNEADHQLTGWQDHVVIYNRVCDATEMKRHSDRRFPLPTP